MKTPVQYQEACPQVSTNKAANNWVQWPQILDTIIVGHFELLEELLSLSLESSLFRWWHFGHGLKFELLISCLYATAWRLPANCQPHPVLHSEGEVDKLIVARCATVEKSLTIISISLMQVCLQGDAIYLRYHLWHSPSLWSTCASPTWCVHCLHQSCELGIAEAATQSIRLTDDKAVPDNDEDDVESLSLSAKPMRGDSAKYDKTAILPHLPRSWIVTGSRQCASSSDSKRVPRHQPRTCAASCNPSWSQDC